MELKNQKRLAADVLKCSTKKVHFDTGQLDDIKEAITKVDIRSLINQGVITQKGENWQSRGRARKITRQKRKNNRKGAGSRKGSQFAGTTRKARWIAKIRALRGLLRKLREKELIERKTYQILYLKAKGGFFRNKRHIKLYIEEHGLLLKRK